MRPLLRAALAPCLLGLVLTSYMVLQRGPPEPGLLLSEVHYTLAWDREGLEEAGAGWSVETDLGYRVTLEEGWLSDYSVALAPCSPEGGSELAGGPWGWLVGPAHAGHGEEADPSSWLLETPRSLHAPSDVDQRVAFPEQRYCRVHTVIARAEDGTLRPDGVDFSRTSLTLAGRWQRGEEEGRFEVHSRWANGALLELDQVLAAEPGTGAALALRVERPLARIFDGVEFATDDERSLNWRVLKNLVDRARVTATRP